jgi:hypothetical protein
MGPRGSKFGSKNSMLRPAYLSQKLDRPLPTQDGGTLRTISDACDCMTGFDSPWPADSANVGLRLIQHYKEETTCEWSY